MAKKNNVKGKGYHFLKDKGNRPDFFDFFLFFLLWPLAIPLAFVAVRRRRIKRSD